MIKLGSHISFKSPEYLKGSTKEALSYGANTFMIYLGPPQNAKRINPTKYFYEDYKKEFSLLIPEKDIVVHAPYIVNPSNPNKKDFAIEFLIQEIRRMNYIKAKYLVLHPGSYTEFNSDIAISTLVESLQIILNKTNDVIICIETMSGKGTEIGINFEQMQLILKKVNNPRLAICLDTCHVWDAGYNIKNYQEFKDILIKFNLLKDIKVIHLNDSKNEISSHKDRHANINQGFIGLKTLKQFVHDPDFDNIPIILETPWVNEKAPYLEEIKMLLEK